MEAAIVTIDNQKQRSVSPYAPELDENLVVAPQPKEQIVGKRAPRQDKARGGADEGVTAVGTRVHLP